MRLSSAMDARRASSRASFPRASHASCRLIASAAKCFSCSTAAMVAASFSFGVNFHNCCSDRSAGASTAGRGCGTLRLSRALSRVRYFSRCASRASWSGEVERRGAVGGRYV
jgi:hypothetical protein